MNWLDRAKILLSRLPIKDRETHGMVAFHFNPNQQILFERIQQQYEKEGKIRVIILKARRVGMSSLTEGLLWAYSAAFANKNSLIVAHLAKSSEDLFRVPRDLSKACPGFASDDIQQKKIRFHHPDGDSFMSVATAGTPSAGRGGTLSALHLSEAAYFPSDEAFTSLITSVSKGSESMVIIESTANGREGPGEAFCEYWDNAVAGRNGYVPVFLSWLDDPMCIRPAEEAEDAPADDLERELMAAPYKATKEQIAWCRRTKSDDCRDDEVKWLVEFPHSPSVAFQVSGSPVFPREELAYAQSTVRPPICRGRFARDSRNQPMWITDDRGPWHIWEFPKDEAGKSLGHKYYSGADAALGTETGDFAAIGIFDGTNGMIAARFAERVPPEELANQLDMSGRFYDRAMVNPELTGNLGRWALVKLRDIFFYPNIYQWKGRDDKKRGKSKSMALGFEMNQATRRLIIDAMRSRLRLGMRKEPGGLQINDQMLMSQMSLATVKEWRWEILRGHDDVFVAMAIAILTCEQYPPARMKYATKVLESSIETKAIEGIAVKSEMAAMIQKEADLFMRRATRRGQRDRLQAI
jgi:hypothetical protein